MQRNRGKQKNEKDQNLFKKTRDIKGTFHARKGMTKSRNGKDLTEAEEIKKRWQEQKRQRRKGKIYPFECRVPKSSRRGEKAFLSDQRKEGGKQKNRKDQRSLKKIRGTKGTFHAKMSSIKDRNSTDLTEAEDIKKRWQEYTELYKK